MAVALEVKNPVLLGFPDETIEDDIVIDFSVSKIGGLPDWIGTDLPQSELACTLCQTTCTLICQIYAPLENSTYHRSLYIFACIQPACWNQAQSWKCFRGQMKVENSSKCDEGIATAVTNSTFDWGTEDDGGWGTEDTSGGWGSHDDDEATLSSQLGAMNVGDQGTSEELHLYDPNGNRLSPSGAGGAVAMMVEEATADIEADQIQEVTIESPDVDLVANNTLIPELFSRANNPQKRTGHFRPLYLAVEEENQLDKTSISQQKDLSDHERQLLLEYKTKEALEDSENSSRKNQGKKQAQPQSDSYEKVAPRHGDMGFHKFLSVIQKNPGHVLRYIKDISHKPLFLSLTAPKDLPKRCSYCGGPVSCEIQLLPTLINSLRLINSDAGCIEFGNLLVYTCFKSCWGDGSLSYRREQVWIEAEASPLFLFFNSLQCLCWPCWRCF